MSDDPNSEGLFAIFEAFLGEAVSEWPWPNASSGSIPFSPRVDEATINRVLYCADLPLIDEGFRRRWWEEYRFGQIHEDAGGFLWRCWCRAMQVPNVFLARYGRQVEP